MLFYYTYAVTTNASKKKFIFSFKNLIFWFYVLSHLMLEVYAIVYVNGKFLVCQFLENGSKNFKIQLFFHGTRKDLALISFTSTTPFVGNCRLNKKTIIRNIKPAEIFLKIPKVFDRYFSFFVQLSHGVHTMWILAWEM